MGRQYSSSRRTTAGPVADYPASGEEPLPPAPRWWLRVASSSPQNPQRTAAEREIARRSDLVAWLTLGLLGERCC